MPSLKSSQTPKLASTAPAIPLRQWRFDAIGTSWWIGVYVAIDDFAWTTLQADITSRIEAFDSTYSRFRNDSIVTAMSQQSGSYELPADAVQLLAWYRQLYTATDGQVTPLIGQALSDAGYDADYTFDTKAMIMPPAWDDVMRYESPVLTTQQPVLLDFGAAGKGYLADIIGEVFNDAGITQYCIDASGDIVVRGVQPALNIGLENPHNADQVVGIASLTNGALCGSAGNRRRWGRFNHILDPQALESPQHIAGVWVTAPTAMEADGLTTALYFTDPPSLQALFHFEYLVLYADGTMVRSAGFEAEIFGESET